MPSEFIGHVEQAFGETAIPETLRTAILRFRSLPPARQEEELASTYLMLERELATAGKSVSKIRAAFRRSLPVHFAPILSRPDMILVFAETGEQERLLCQRLLLGTLDHAKTLLGAADGNFLASVAGWIETVPHASPPVPFALRSTIPVRDSEWVALLLRLGRELHQRLEGKLGETCVRSFFERSYDRLARSYGLLETFPVVVSLLPPKLLDSEKLSQLSRSQMQTVILQKIAELNDINTQLQSQYRELDEARHGLMLAKDELEERVAERTADLRLANDELKAAKEKAEGADRAKTEFLANMSHELRTPLNAIIGFSEIIRDAGMGPLDAQYRDFATEIHGSGQHLLALINDILDLSKIEAGRLELSEDVLSLAELGQACLGVVKPKSDAAQVAVDFAVPAELPPIQADWTRLKQILLNLVANGIKFTPPGGRVVVSAGTTEAGGVSIMVEDTGIGMRAEDIPRALEPFRQIDGKLDRQYSGAGLGLPLVKRLTELHGGWLTIESAPGRGTTVTVHLPSARVLARAA